MATMFEAAQLEMPYLRDMPRREKSKAVKVWDSLRQLTSLVPVEGIPIPQAFAGKILGVSTQRVGQLVDAGRLRVVIVNDHRFVTEKSVLEFAQSDRKAGRPFGSVGDRVKLGARIGLDAVAEKARKLDQK